MHSRRTKTSTNNDSILRHFILLGLFLIEAVIKVIELIRPEQRIDNKVLYNNDRGDSINSRSIHKSSTDYNIELKNRISESKSTKELKDILRNIDLISDFKKEELVNIIMSNKQALNKFMTEEKEKQLFLMTNQELKNLLKGADKLSRLKKSELVAMVLDQENLKS